MLVKFDAFLLCIEPWRDFLASQKRNDYLYILPKALGLPNCQG